jgi:cytochrome c-type biogenesis protein CcmH
MGFARIVSAAKNVTGWIIMIAMAVVTGVALVIIGRLPRRTWEAVAAASVLAMAGYALQGRPGLAGAPAGPVAGKTDAAADMIAMRADMDQSFSAARPYLILSDAYARDGEFQFAASYIRSGIRKNPANADLWAGLGLQLLLASDGQMSPPAVFAFEKAHALSPRQPAPDYFAGLSALFSGQAEEALGRWQDLLARTPKDAKWRPRLESQIRGLQTMQAAEQAKATRVN